MSFISALKGLQDTAPPPKGTHKVPYVPGFVPSWELAGVANQRGSLLVTLLAEDHTH